MAFLAAEAIAKGKAVIDCGATDSIGSAPAVEVAMNRNSDKQKIKIDYERKKNFIFGNANRQKTISHVTLPVKAGIKAGAFGLHVLDVDGVPMLASIKTLVSLGAIIDFKNGLAIFSEIDAERVVVLERASSGHLLLDVSGDIMEPVNTDVAAEEGIRKLQNKSEPRAPDSLSG